MKFLALPLSIGFQPINFYNTDWLTVYVEGGVVPNFILNLKSENIKKGYLETPEINKFSWAYQLSAGVEIKVFKKFALIGSYTYMKDFTPFFEIYKNHPDHYTIFNKTALIKLGAMMKIN
jgi:opacity protein-like surface antigen